MFELVIHSHALHTYIYFLFKESLGTNHIHEESNPRWRLKITGKVEVLSLFFQQISPLKTYL